MVVEIRGEKRGLDSKLHPIDLNDPYIRFTLCYPQMNCDELYNRVKELVEWGVSFLVEEGKNIFGFRVVGKGYSSIATIAIREDVKGVLKIRRLDSRRGSLEFEGFMLDFLDRFGIVPKPIFYSRDYIFMEFLSDCLALSEYINELSNSRVDYNSILRIVKKAMYTLYIPDFYRIDHTELSRAGDHIYLCGDGVRIIDWESATIRSKPSNVSSFISYLINRTLIRNLLSSNRVRDLILTLKMYKETYSIKKLQELIKLLAEPLPQRFSQL